MYYQNFTGREDPRSTLLGRCFNCSSRLSGDRLYECVESQGSKDVRSRKRRRKNFRFHGIDWSLKRLFEKAGPNRFCTFISLYKIDVSVFLTLPGGRCIF